MPVDSSFANFVEALADKVEIAAKNLANTTVLKDVCTERSTTKKTQRIQDYENSGTAGMIPENGLAPELHLREGFPWACTQNQYGCRMSITEEAMLTKNEDLVGRMTKQMKRANEDLLNILPTYYLHYGNATGSSVPKLGGSPAVNTVGSDGLSLFNSAHRWRDNSNAYTYSNRSQTSSGITESSIETMFSLIRRLKDNQNRPLNLQPKRLYVPPELVADAIRALKSRLTPSTANNAVNTTPELMQQNGYLENQWLPSATRWYIETSATDAGINWYWLKRPGMSRWKDDATGADNMKINWFAAHGSPRLLRFFLCGEGA